MGINSSCSLSEDCTLSDFINQTNESDIDSNLMPKNYARPTVNKILRASHIKYLNDQYSETFSSEARAHISQPSSFYKELSSDGSVNSDDNDHRRDNHNQYIKNKMTSPKEKEVFNNDIKTGFSPTRNNANNKNNTNIINNINQINKQSTIDTNYSPVRVDKQNDKALDKHYDKQIMKVKHNEKIINKNPKFCNPTDDFSVKLTYNPEKLVKKSNPNDAKNVDITDAIRKFKELENKFVELEDIVVLNKLSKGGRFSKK